MGGETIVCVGWGIGVPVGAAVSVGLAAGWDSGAAGEDSGTAVAEAGAITVAIGVCVGVTVQKGGGVGFHAVPGVGITPFSGGAGARGTPPTYPWTKTTSSATQPLLPSSS